MQDPKQDVNVDEILLTETVAVIKVYVSLHYDFSTSLHYDFSTSFLWMKAQDAIHFADTNKRQTLGSAEKIWSLVF